MAVPDFQRLMLPYMTLSGVREFVKSIASNIILIDGEELAEYMIDYNVGVSITGSYEIKRIDSDYFEEE